MNDKRVSIFAASALIFVCAVCPSNLGAATPPPRGKPPAKPVVATTPTDQVRISVDNIVAILKNPALKAESRKKERRDQLRRAIFSRFDFTEMAQRSMGSNWRDLNAKQRAKVVHVSA